MRQTAPQDESPIAGKMMNCRQFGSYEPREASTATKNLCHGGWVGSQWYEPCPVKTECYQRTAAQVSGRLPVINNPTGAARGLQQSARRLPLFRAPDLSELPTHHAQAVNEVQRRIGGAVAAAAAEVGAHAPAVVHPKKDAPPGMRSAFLEHDIGGMAPAFLPKKGQSTVDRLMKNIVQSIIAAIGYAIWSFTRRTDLFDDD